MITFVLVTILFITLFLMFIFITAGIARNKLPARAKGLLQAHRFDVTKVQYLQSERSIEGMHTFVAFYKSTKGVQQQRSFCVPRRFDRIYWLEDEVEPLHPWTTAQPQSSKEQTISDLSAENAELKRQIEQMKLKD